MNQLAAGHGSGRGMWEGGGVKMQWCNGLMGDGRSEVRPKRDACKRVNIILSRVRWYQF